MEHTFANSYGAPFVSSYKPPPCEFNRVTINFTVVVKGRQFDRLGIMYLGDVEVFRTSTSEPSPNGITWSYVKEMDMYNALWNEEQTIIFDLPNIVNNVYTGLLHTKLMATFSSQQEGSNIHANTILPISAGRSTQGKGSAFMLPGDQASTSYKLGKNIDRAVVSLSACGQQAEEFWYTNVLTGDTDVFKNTTGELGGFSPFREVQLLIDGQLAGVSWPFFIVFTGGIAPGFWRPVVGIDAYDLRNHEIDITPWLGVLSDGSEHTFEINVVGLAESSSSTPQSASLSDHVGGYWIVTGTMFLFEGNSTTPQSPQPSNLTINAPAPKIETFSTTTQNLSGINETLFFDVFVTRDLLITSSTASFHQTLKFQTTSQLTSYGETQYVILSTTGTDTATSPGHNFQYKYSYPLTLNSSIRTYSPEEGLGFSITASLNRRLDTQLYGPSTFPSGLQNWTLFPSYDPHAPQLTHNTIERRALPQEETGQAYLNIEQAGRAAYHASRQNGGSYSFGDLITGLEFSAKQGQSGEVYKRRTAALNSTIREDVYSLRGWDKSEGGEISGSSSKQDGAIAMGSQAVEHVMGARDNARALLGRGHGDVKQGYAADAGVAASSDPGPEF